jgi:3-dehydroquinate dehydratase/shikimate dehydrogenase
VTGALVHSIREDTPEAALRGLEESPRACALVELRADQLRPGDVAGLVRRAGRPVVATVRGIADGGSFDGSTDEKRAILDAALSAGAAFVDVEWDGPLRPYAFGPRASRTILSHHGASCDAATLGGLFEAMAGTHAERLKIVPAAKRPRDVHAVRDLLARARVTRRPLAAFASGPAGIWSRVFAISWGSWGTYGAAARGKETGDGQLVTQEMLDVYRVLSIGEATRIFALCGAPLSGSPSPSVHAAGYRSLELDAIYVPLETDDWAEVGRFVEESGAFALSGAGVTIPLKEQAAKACARLDPFAACGSANTVRFDEGGWQGFNTDAPAALALVREHLEPRGLIVAIAGAGATARAIGAALAGAGAIVTLFGRDAARARDTAHAIGADSAPLTSLPRAAWDVLVQATPAGRHGEEVLSRRHLNGRMVLDAAYGAEPTPLVRAALARGLKVADGLDLLLAQAVLQFTCLTGRPAPRPAMAAALQPWRNASSA